MLTLLLLSSLALTRAPAPDSSATATAIAIVDTAIVRMGGADVLGGIERVRLEMMTQWQRTAFDERPYPDQPSYEWHSELRDYTIPAWRNTRRFAGGGKWAEITDVVRDSVAIRQLNGTWAPLNVAYVDERRELFAFSPDRLLLLARAADDLRSLADTVVAGTPHARVAATVDGFPATLFFRRTDGLLAVARYRAAQPNDFGLAPWGEMEVELWYSSWRRLPSGVALPLQWDVRRVGRPYKRMTVLAATFDSVAAPDSFAVTDSLRTAFFATADRAMYDVPLDSARIVDERFASFGGFGAPAGAVKLGRQWVLLEAGQAPLITERAVRWLESYAPGAKIAGALITMPAGSNGGAAWLAGQRVPLHVAPGARPFVRTILRNHRQSESAATALARGQWLRVDGDSLWIEPIDLPDAAGSMLVYVPSLRWAYSAMAVAPLQAEYVMRRVRERGWEVERLGTIRGVTGPVPGGPAAAAAAKSARAARP